MAGSPGGTGMSPITPQQHRAAASRCVERAADELRVARAQLAAIRSPEAAADDAFLAAAQKACEKALKAVSGGIAG